MNYSNLNTFRNNSNFRLSNENLLLIEILNVMYNDNYRQINLITNILNNLVESNNNIRNLLVQLLNSNQNSNNYSRRNNPRRWENNFYTTFTRFSAQPLNLNNIDRNNRNQINNDGLFNQIFNNFLQPVEIYPTQSQIETATRNVRYCDISQPINTSCPISMENFEDNDMVTVIRNCGHTFHTEHLMNWFRSNCRCPVCRYDIRDYSTNVGNQFFNNSQQVVDISNNNIEGNDDRNNNLQQSSVELFIDYYNMIPQDTLNGNLDLSGNHFSDLISLLLESMNRTRNNR